MTNRMDNLIAKLNLEQKKLFNKNSKNLDEIEKLIYTFTIINGKIQNKDVQNLTGFKATKSLDILKDLSKKNLIHFNEIKGQNGSYTIVST